FLIILAFSLFIRKAHKITFRFVFFFFFKHPPTTKTYTTRHTLSLHDALPICPPVPPLERHIFRAVGPIFYRPQPQVVMKRSEEHTSELQSRLVISYAVFC